MTKVSPPSLPAVTVKYMLPRCFTSCPERTAVQAIRRRQSPILCVVLGGDGSIRASKSGAARHPLLGMVAESVLAEQA